MSTFHLLVLGSIAPSAGAFFVFWAKLPPTRWALAQQRYRWRLGFRGCLAVGERVANGWVFAAKVLQVILRAA